MHLFRAAVDPGRGGLQPQVATRLGEERLRLEEQPLARELAGEVRLGKRRPLIGRIRLVADQRERSREALGAEAGRGLNPGLPCPYDDDAFHAVCRDNFGHRRLARVNGGSNEQNHRPTGRLPR
jgi:hypothetical protein